MSKFPSPVTTWHTEAYPAIDPARPELSAKGKTIVMTGGGTGIGAETARYFAKAGAARIALLGRREQPLIATKASIRNDFPDVHIFTAVTDVTITSDVEAAFGKFAGDGKLDVLVSNAGMLGAVKPIKDVNMDEWFEGIAQNVQGAFIVAQVFLRYAATDAALINVSSAVAHLNLLPGISSYCVSKAATSRFFDSLAYEHPQVRVFNLQPGAVLTAMSKDAGYSSDQSKGKDEEPSGYDSVSLPAAFIVWLASPEARFLKGKFLWANWDVNELKARAKEIEAGALLDLGLTGWPFPGVGSA